MKVYEITPVPKPRQTVRDKWMKRPCVMRYRAFADQCRELIREIPRCPTIIFVMPMPSSWGKNKKVYMDHTPHTQTPDIDNLLKSFLDALFENDCAIWSVHVCKVWGKVGQIKVGEIWQSEQKIPL